MPSLRRFYRTLVARLPWWAAVVLAVVGLAIGVAITAKPFASLGVLVALVAIALVVTGISEVASARSSLGRWGGVAWIVVGVVLAVWPGLTIRGLAIFVGVSLLVGGVLRIIEGVRRDAGELPIALLSGLASAIFGVLALVWSDVTVLVVALLVGPALILFGFEQLAAALRPRRADGAERSERRWPSWLRAVGVCASLLLALGLLAVSAVIHRSSASPTAFYSAPSSIPSEAGVLLRSEPFTTAIPNNARGWRILYTTTRADGIQAVASGVVVVGKEAPAGPRPVIAWAHGTTGFARHCAPSLLETGLAAGAMPDLGQVIANGWVLVATDYVGLGTNGPHPYLIGDPTARSVLDSVRAARELDEVDLDKRTVVWGHSQGGGAALWAGILAPTYAPDDDVIGVAAISPASNLPALVDRVKDAPVGKIMGSYVLSAYGAKYRDVRLDDYVRPGARVLVHRTAARCLSGPEALVSVATAALGRGPWFSRSPGDGPLGKRLEQNVPLGLIHAPLLIGQGLSDTLVQPTVQQRFVKRLCNLGQSLEYRVYKGLDHVAIVLDRGSPLLPELIAWTKDRFAGKAQQAGCVTIER